MNDTHCIYFGDKPYYITNCLNEQLYLLTTIGGTIIVNHPTPTSITQTIHDIEHTEAGAVIILTSKPSTYWNIFQEQFDLVQAGGGLVKNEKDEYLFIFRRGKWDLPKGKWDEGETIEACALREVTEETGLTSLSMQDHICDTWHVYREKGRVAPILKESVWYAMQSSSHQPLTPQTEEDITDIKWLKASDWGQVLGNTFPSIKLVLEASQK